jgi:hypothetical protein
MPEGSCLCGAVRIAVSAPIGPADACHCHQCRKQTGHYLASTNVPRTALTVTGEDKIGWYRSSDKVRRGFCTICGSMLFWDPLERDWTSIAMGAFEAPTGTRLEMHIFVADKGDYYEIADGLPQRAQ